MPLSCLLKIAYSHFLEKRPEETFQFAVLGFARQSPSLPSYPFTLCPSVSFDPSVTSQGTGAAASLKMSRVPHDLMVKQIYRCVSLVMSGKDGEVFISSSGAIQFRIILRFHVSSPSPYTTLSCFMEANCEGAVEPQYFLTCYQDGNILIGTNTQMQISTLHITFMQERMN